MNKVLVHLHLFYHEQLPYFIEKLQNINTCYWDLIVTVCEHVEESEKMILDFKPDAEIRLVENNGYDILPFLNVIKSVNLDDYDLVLKLHTKNVRKRIVININGIPFKNSFWEKRLVDSLLYSKGIFFENLRILCDDRYGMVADSFFTIKLLSYPEDTYLLDQLKSELNIKSDYSYFIAGSMFLIRASILKRLAKYNIEEDKIESATGSTSTIYHAIERIFTILTDDEGYEVYKVPMF